jgi:hypothetical protein
LSCFKRFGEGFFDPDVRLIFAVKVHCGPLKFDFYANAMRKVIFTLATGLFLVAGVSTSNACDGHKKVTKASSQAAVTGEKKECTTAEKKECATTKTGKTASAEKSCCMSKAKGVEAKKDVRSSNSTVQAKL